jgi:hypothetical protein
MVHSSYRIQANQPLYLKYRRAPVGNLFQPGCLKATETAAYKGVADMSRYGRASR